VDGLGYPLRFRLTGGERHDITQAEVLLENMTFEYVIADRSYDADPLVAFILQSGAIPVIPSRAKRKQPREYDTWLYRERHLVECFVNKLKQFRHVFSRFDKLATRFLGFLYFVSTLIWLR
jgi:transposase